MKKYTIFFVLIIMAISACGNTPEQAVEPQVITTVVVEDQQVGNANTNTNGKAKSSDSPTGGRWSWKDCSRSVKRSTRPSPSSS